MYRAGDSCYELKDFTKAQAFWEELVTTLPASALIPDANEGLGWIYFSAKNYEKAATAFKSTADSPQNKRAAWSKLMEGRALAELGKDAFAAFKLVPTLTGFDKNVDAELLIRSTEIMLNSPTLSQDGKSAETLKTISTQLQRLAQEFPALPGTISALDIATFRMVETKHSAESADFASLYLNVTAANHAVAPKRSAMARIRALC